MKQVKRKFIRILILLMVCHLFIMVNSVEAAFWADIFEAGDKFIEDGKGAQIQTEETANGTITTITADDRETRKIIDDIYTILFPLGIVTTVIVGGILGIKFMLASAEDKAKVKESMVPYVIGCIVIYGAFGIWKIVIEVLSGI